jgi:hypothetical protein
MRETEADSCANMARKGSWQTFELPRHIDTAVRCRHGTRHIACANRQLTAVSRESSLISDETPGQLFFFLIITTAGFRDAEPLEPGVLFEFG